MSEITVRPVPAFGIARRIAMRRFHLFARRVYAGDPLWVPPLIPERMKATSPRTGVFFRRGEAEFFVAYRGRAPVGTICASVDPPTNERRGAADCVFGFFECVEDYEVAEALFGAAARWGRERGLDALFGPFNLDYENSYGVLIDGRDRPPALMCGHTPPYYADFMIRYGFEKARGDNLAFAVDLDPNTGALKRLHRLARMAESRGRFSVRSVNLDRWDEEVDTIHRLLVESLAHLPGSVPWRRDVLEESLLPFRKLADPELVLFAMHGGETVGWFPGVANLNEVFIKVNGLRFPWNYATLLRNIGRQTECLTVKSVLVLPHYWNTGAAILLFSEMARRAYAKGYRWVDLSLTAEDNPQTPIIAERLGAREYKRYRVYRKQIAVTPR